MKSGVEHLAQHPGWKTTKKESKYQFGKKESKPEEVKIVLTLEELNALIDKMDDALDGDSNDYEHDVLFQTRDELAEMSTDPDRRR
jgi:hypothetical protein